MAVYVDVLICLNVFVNFLLIQIVSAVNKFSFSLPRRIFASLLGALGSLYIFAPSGAPLIELLIRISIACAVIALLSLPCTHTLFLKNLAIFFGVSFVYAGVMFAFWFALKPANLVVNNGVVYYNISPLFMICVTIIAYIILKIIGRFFLSSKAQKYYDITVFLDSLNVSMRALADTGHSLKDMFSNSAVIVIDPKQAQRLFPSIESVQNATSLELASRYRLIPYKSVGGTGMLNAYRCDKMEIRQGKSVKIIGKPVVAISDRELSGEYSAIIDAAIAD